MRVRLENFVVVYPNETRVTSHTLYLCVFGLLQFRHSVVEVDPVIGNDGSTVWNVTAENCESGCQSTSQFDSVIVCNG